MSDQTDDDRSVQSSEDNAYVAVTGNNIPIVTISTHRDLTEKIKPPLPPPPAHRYRYTTWHNLRSNEIKGCELRNPRVRKGPEIKEIIFYTLTDEKGRPIHHELKGTKRLNYEKQVENWETSNDINLSHQELGHAYQVDNSVRILQRFTKAERIQLMDNDLKDLQKVNFPRCKELNLRQNFFSKFKDLPKCPVLEVLNLADNSINSVDDLFLLAHSPLRSLDLRRNPICFTPEYRQRVFYNLPNLTELDGIQQLPSDLEYDPPVTSSCILS